jgi:hypothetical protein
MGILEGGEIALFQKEEEGNKHNAECTPPPPPKIAFAYVLSSLLVKSLPSPILLIGHRGHFAFVNWLMIMYDYFILFLLYFPLFMLFLIILFLIVNNRRSWE